MAQADWNYRKDGTGIPVGGDDGEARLHSGLSSPLTTEGLYCREFTSANANDYRIINYITSSYNSGEFYEMDSSKSISIRAWLRGANFIGTSRTAVGITAKLNAGGSQASTNQLPKGYNLYIGRTGEGYTAGQLKLALDNKVGAERVVNILSISHDTWYKVRLDVTPVGASQDIVEVYTGTGDTGSEVWTLRATEIVLSTDGQWVPWAESGEGRVGYFHMHESTGRNLYIDRFQVFTEAV